MNTLTDLQDPSTTPVDDRRPNARYPLVQQRFVGVGVFGAGLVPGLVWAVTGTAWGLGLVWALGFYALALSLAGWGFRSTYPHGRVGLCNVVTIARLALISALVGALASDTVALAPMLFVAIAAFALDGVDGWLARRTHLASDFGARFDVEVDSSLALILACLAVQAGLSPFVILLGLPRYLFGAAQWVFPALTGPLADRFSRKVVCVVQIAALIVMTIPWLDPALRHTIAVMAGASVIWSFAVDIRALSRTRP